MYYECCVCKTSRQDTTLYHFPCSEQRLLIWFKCLASVRNLKLSPKKISSLFLCQKHFEKRFITQSSRLLGRAYPTLFTKEEIASGQSSRDDAENIDPKAEHSYSRKIHIDHTYAKLEPFNILPQMIVATTSSLLDVPKTSQQLPARHDPTASSLLGVPGTTEQLPARDDPTASSLLGVTETTAQSPTRHDTIASSLLGVPKTSQQLPTRCDTTASSLLDVPGTTEQLPATQATPAWNLLVAPNTSQESPTSQDTPAWSLLVVPNTSQQLTENQDTTATSLLGVSRTVQQLSESQDTTDSNLLNVSGTSQQSPESHDSGLGKARLVHKESITVRKRLVHKLKDLTPTGQKIYKEYNKVKNQLSFYKRTQRALRKENSLLKEKSFRKVTKHMSPFAKKLMQMQINQRAKDKKGRRYTEDDKQIALSIMKQSPECYRFLQKIFILPSPTTLNKMTGNSSRGTEIEPSV